VVSASSLWQETTGWYDSDLASTPRYLTPRSRCSLSLSFFPLYFTLRWFCISSAAQLQHCLHSPFFISSIYLPQYHPLPHILPYPLLVKIKMNSINLSNKESDIKVFLPLFLRSKVSRCSSIVGCVAVVVSGTNFARPSCCWLDQLLGLQYSWEQWAD
jgi:hypothetical protein